MFSPLLTMATLHELLADVYLGRYRFPTGPNAVSRRSRAPAELKTIRDHGGTTVADVLVGVRALGRCRYRPGVVGAGRS
jgi:hypothetical protein